MCEQLYGEKKKPKKQRPDGNKIQLRNSGFALHFFSHFRDNLPFESSFLLFWVFFFPPVHFIEVLLTYSLPVFLNRFPEGKIYVVGFSFGYVLGLF